jgi:hypothetical protein
MESEMDWNLITAIFGWMLLINVILFIIGVLKITIFKNFTKKWIDLLFGDESEALYATIPKALVNYEILILVFNLAPYFALRIVL